ncbi:hypothetical protein RI367_002795 [Sorochytrium milnesiophthora]
MAKVLTSHAQYWARIEGVYDALLVVEACRRGVLPLVTRRLSDRKRGSIQPGAVYVWKEQKTGLKRWTDGKSWSPSRVHGSFLMYRECHPKAHIHMLQQKDPQLDVRRSHRGDYCYLPDGLCKKTIAIETTCQEVFHLVAYYKKGERALLECPRGECPAMDMIDGAEQQQQQQTDDSCRCNQRPSVDTFFAKIRLPESMYPRVESQNTLHKPILLPPEAFIATSRDNSLDVDGKQSTVSDNEQQYLADACAPSACDGSNNSSVATLFPTPPEPAIDLPYPSPLPLPETAHSPLDLHPYVYPRAASRPTVAAPARYRPYPAAQQRPYHAHTAPPAQRHQQQQQHITYTAPYPSPYAVPNWAPQADSGGYFGCVTNSTAHNAPYWPTEQFRQAWPQNTYDTHSHHHQQQYPAAWCPATQGSSTEPPRPAAQPDASSFIHRKMSIASLC